jgi:hypothetical protein
MCEDFRGRGAEVLFESEQEDGLKESATTSISAKKEVADLEHMYPWMWRADS